MLEKEYEELVRYLEEMIEDSVQLVHAGLMDWEDTKIPQLLREIKRKKEAVQGLSVEGGTRLTNRITGETAHVIYFNDDIIQFSPSKKVLTYPRDKLWYHYEKTERSE